MTWKKMTFYKCDECSFETIFEDQFNQHKKWQHMSKRKRKADMEANTSFGKRRFTAIVENDKSQEKKKLLAKTSYQCKECQHKA